MTAKKFFLVLLLLLVLSFVGVAGAYTWGSGKSEEKAMTVSDLKAERDVSEEAILKLKKAQSDAENVDEVVAVLDRLLPKEKEQDKLIADIIYTATAEAGIPFSQVASFSFNGGDEPGALSGTTQVKGITGVYEYPFNVNINNISYETLLQLLREIETNGRIIQVDNVGISPEAATSNVNVQLSMKAYLKP